MRATTYFSLPLRERLRLPVLVPLLWLNEPALRNLHVGVGKQQRNLIERHVCAQQFSPRRFASENTRSGRPPPLCVAGSTSALCVGKPKVVDLPVAKSAKGCNTSTVTFAWNNTDVQPESGVLESGGEARSDRGTSRVNANAGICLSVWTLQISHVKVVATCEAASCACWVPSFSCVRHGFPAKEAAV